MSQSKVTGTLVVSGATASSLPVTGSPVVMIVAMGLALVVGGLLMLRAGRYQRTTV
jgi:LPXTG-motif cell wall-anchored protein